MPQYYRTRRHAQYTLNATPTQIAIGQQGTTRLNVTIFNPGATSVALSNSASDTTNVLTLPPGASLEDEDSQDAWYASAPSGSGTVQIVETSSM